MSEYRSERVRRTHLAVIAMQLGHSDTRMVEKRYGHLAPSYLAETVRAAFGALGLIEESNVVPLLPRTELGELRETNRPHGRPAT